MENWCDVEADEADECKVVEADDDGWSKPKRGRHKKNRAYRPPALRAKRTRHGHHVWVVRGLPGAGKNTWVNNNLGKFPDKVVLGMADFLEDGDEENERERRYQAYKDCKREFYELLERVDDPEQEDVQVIVLVNPYLTPGTLKFAQKAAAKHMYNFHVVDVVCKNEAEARAAVLRSSAELPAVYGETMFRKWKPWRGAITVPFVSTDVA